MITVKLCAFSDEADASLEGQIAALKRNNCSSSYGPWCVKIRFADTEGDYVFKLLGNIEIFPYARGLNIPCGRTDDLIVVNHY